MLLLALAIAAAVAVGIAASVGTAGSSKKSAGYKVFLLPKFIGIPVFTQNGAGAKAAAKELGDTVTYNGPTEADATKQVPFIDNAVRQGYNAIIISANDPNTVAPALKRAMAKGVKFGRPRKLDLHQRHEALERIDRGDTYVAIARTYSVDPNTIARLARAGA